MNGGLHAVSNGKPLDDSVLKTEYEQIFGFLHVAIIHTIAPADVTDKPSNSPATYSYYYCCMACGTSQALGEWAYRPENETDSRLGTGCHVMCL